ncbi:uncharacterized protein TRIADDRAFT_19422 [Trichoplax adhaerens]|uniref:Ribosomal protein S6 kinase n=1 Tax=Trichoplax adhaerens TaxID=10228 RepID=B3RJY0_TRIAD|nr:hypothetical protein TRIADDRAFT_19422 [Trichoplax adhaerens]EDV29862.1 hypothetical protein TRIADDRAFT_19422 [Trichoplax adhaerens]|eukprot:XP_002109064.1 hypothetical protein TRIADDRAFT_19422 [Trichoplax adhaerens]
MTCCSRLNYLLFIHFCLGNLTGHDEKVGPENFELLKVLGTGAYAKVFLVKKRTGFDTGKLFAMKVLKKATIIQKAKTTERTMTERSILEAVRESPFIVTLHYAYQTDSKLHLILDYVSGGELFTHLAQREYFKESEVKFYIGEITLAIEHLHKLGIIYRDLKLENVLLDRDGHVILTDFGLSKEFVNVDSNNRTYSYCGTMEYMAPEVVRGDRQGHNETVDWWSLGVLTYELLTGASPFTTDDDANSHSAIAKRILETSPILPMLFSKEAKSFISGLLKKNPKFRLGSGKNGAEEIKSHAFFKGIDMNALKNKRITPPFRPPINGELDVSNFSSDFTDLTPVDSPSQPVKSTGLFKGYSFVSPAILFGHSMFLNEDIFAINQRSQTMPTELKNSQFHKVYQLGSLLGNGSFSTVRKCTHKETGKEFAVKIVSRRLNTTREEQILKLLQSHEHIVTLHDIKRDSFHTYLVFELLRGGELLQRIRKKKNFDEKEASRLMRQLISAVQFMHKRRIVHRDLKPENILFVSPNEESSIKIIDFGFARKKVENQPLKTPCFSLPCAAPEVLLQDLPDYGYHEACDLWSLGVIMYIMLSGRVPFHHISSARNIVRETIEKITSGNFTFDGPEWKTVSDSAKSLIGGLLTVDPMKRLTIDAVIEHDWFKKHTSRLAPLMTPENLDSSFSSVDFAMHATMDAFHQALKSGFSLMDVGSAPLAKRRKLKKHDNGLSERNSSSSSN